MTVTLGATVLGIGVATCVGTGGWGCAVGGYLAVAGAAGIYGGLAQGYETYS